MTRTHSKVKPHPYVYDAELSRGSGKRLCHGCGLPGRPGDNRHLPAPRSITDPLPDGAVIERPRYGD